MATSNNIITRRRHDLDNMRSSLTALVIVHHTAVAYGGSGLGPFRSALFPAEFVSAPLLCFNAFNQSFFMGLFFWMSGRVSAQSLRRSDAKGQSREAFVRSKALRLALPAVLYTLAVGPIVRLLALPKWTTSAAGRCLRQYFQTLQGVRGPVWYTATLFAFDFCAALVKPRASVPSETTANGGVEKSEAYNGSKMPEQWGWAAVAATSYLVRLLRPVGIQAAPLGIQPGYAAQYIFAYAMGHLSYHIGQQHMHGPLSSTKVDDARRLQTRFGLATASAISLLAFPLIALPNLVANSPQWAEQTMKDAPGGWNLSAAAYATWNELSFVLVGPALMECFSKWYNEPAVSWIWQPRYSYSAFLVHMVVSTVIEVKVDGLLSSSIVGPSWHDSSLWRLVGPVALTVVVGAFNTVASFALGRLAVEYIPGIDRVI